MPLNPHLRRRSRTSISEKQLTASPIHASLPRRGHQSSHEAYGSHPPCMGILIRNTSQESNGKDRLRRAAHDVSPASQDFRDLRKSLTILSCGTDFRQYSAAVRGSGHVQAGHRSEEIHDAERLSTGSGWSAGPNESTQSYHVSRWFAEATGVWPHVNDPSDDHDLTPFNHTGNSFGVKIHDPKPQILADGFAAIGKKAGLEEDLTIIGIEISVDWFPKDRSDDRRLQMTAALMRHHLPARAVVDLLRSPRDDLRYTHESQSDLSEYALCAPETGRRVLRIQRHGCQGSLRQTTDTSRQVGAGSVPRLHCLPRREGRRGNVPLSEQGE